MRRSIAALLKSRSGVAVVEFGLVAPVIILALLSMIDVGRAIHQRLALGAALQTGAQLAMSDPGAEAVRAAVEMADTATAPSASRGPLSISVSRTCTCASDTGVSVDCAATCPGSRPTEIAYSLRAESTMAGILLPTISFSAEGRVRVR